MEQWAKEDWFDWQLECGIRCTYIQDFQEFLDWYKRAVYSAVTQHANLPKASPNPRLFCRDCPENSQCSMRYDFDRDDYGHYVRER